MDVVRLRISYSFARERIPLGWRELRFGLVNDLVDLRAPIEMAAEKVAEQKNPVPELLELSRAFAREPPQHLVDRLADAEPEQADDDQLRDEWLYLVLAWLYEHRDEESDPLQRVEEVYADFGYPDEVAKFVRYMPMDGADLGSREANEQRLYQRWKQYIDDAAKRYRRS